jgi:hypothetical protein
LFCGSKVTEEEGYGQQIWCSKSGFCALSGLEDNPSSNERDEIAKENNAPKRKLTQLEKQSIIKKHRSCPQLTQKSLAAWAMDEFELKNLAQNTISNILAEAHSEIQKGKLTHDQRRQILEEYERNPKITQKKLAHWAQQTFNLLKSPSQSTISAIINKKLLSMSADVAITDQSKKRLSTVSFPDLDEALRIWVLQCEAKRISISGCLIQEKARLLADKLGIPKENQPTFSVGWLTKFQARYGFRSLKMSGEAASADEAAITVKLPEIVETVKQYDIKDVFNMDETGLFYRMAPDRTIASQNLSGSKKEKSRISIAFTANADGSEKLPPLFIGHFQKPRAFGKKSAKQHGFQYKFNTKAWMTGAIFQDWIMDFDKDMRKQQRNVLLLLDNAPSHVVGNLQLTNVKVVFFPPNTTSRIQPMDAGIIAAFKKRYRSYQLKQALDLNTLGRKDIYKVDVLQAMVWSRAAWNALTPTAIHNCWKHSGVLGSEDSPEFWSRSYCDDTNLDDKLAKTMQELHCKDPFSVDDLIDSADEPETVHMQLLDDELVEFVQAEVDEEPMEDGNADDDVVEVLTSQEKINALRTVGIILNAEPDINATALRTIRRLLKDLNELEREKREMSLCQPTIHSFFRKMN